MAHYALNSLYLPGYYIQAMGRFFVVHTRAEQLDVSGNKI
jgi:hypothetical protein